MSRSPRFAVWLLRRVATKARRDEIECDLLDNYEVWQKKGKTTARLRLWREVLLIPLWRGVAGWRKRRDGVPIVALPSQHVGAAGRSARSPTPLQPLAHDIRYGIRGMSKSPGFAFVAVLILGVGIGANSTMFTLVHSLFMQAPPAIVDPQDLVGLNLVYGDETIAYHSYPDYEFYRDNNDVFSDIMAYDDGATAVAVGLGAEVVQADAWTVSHNFFSVLGVRPVVGRTFLPEEDVIAGEHPVVLISYGLWKRQFAEDPGVVNSTVVINGRSFMIVGVVPREFRGPNIARAAPDLYLPLHMVGTIQPGGEESLRAEDDTVWLWLRVVARLRPEVDLEGARAHLSVLQTRWEEAFASWIEATFNDGDRDQPYRVALADRFYLTNTRAAQLRQFLTPLFLAVGAVLIIACANIAILLLARASVRHREMGIRSALGASRGRVVAQLLTESLLLAGLGGALGIALTYWAANVAAGLIPMSFARDFKPDLPVAGFTLIIAGGAAVLFGLVPALQLSRADIAAFLHRPGHGGSRANIRNALVVGQLTLSIVLVTAAGLFVRSLLNAQRVDLGFEKAGRLFLDVIPANHGYSEEAGRAFLRVMIERLEALPVVRNASITDRTPFRGRWSSTFAAPGTEYGEERFQSGFNSVGPGYFETMGIPIVAGRGFAPSDDALAPNVVVVNERVAEQVWPGESAVGKIIERREQDWTVIGVARNAVYYEIGEETVPQTYVPFFQDYRAQTTFVVATNADPYGALHQVEQVIRDYDPNIAIFNIRTLAGEVAEELGQFSLMAVLVVLFGALALLLSAVGLYGVQSFLVSRRTREIGIRMALGAFERQVAGAVMGRGVALAGVGIVIGVLAAYASAQLIQNLLFGVRARDPLTFVTVPAVLLCVAAVASLIPAVRASRVDPVEALREE